MVLIDFLKVKTDLAILSLNSCECFGFMLLRPRTPVFVRKSVGQERFF